MSGDYERGRADGCRVMAKAVVESLNTAFESLLSSHREKFLASPDEYLGLVLRTIERRHLGGMGDEDLVRLAGVDAKGESQ